ncbi:MAG: esterase/lipase family protein [Candidatus Latescibacterota bacterium]
MADEPQRDVVILIHGFFRTGRDMHRLRNLLAEYGWRASAITVPSFFGALDDCVDTLGKKLAGMRSDAGRIHLVGHSFGGLVIRAFLARNRMPNLGRCVLIGTPNRGACLADLEAMLLPGIRKVVKPLHALVTTAAPIPPPLNSPPPEIGVIASDNPHLLGGLLIPGKSDGRVELSSTPLDGMADYILVPFIHTRMHKRRETAELADRFLRTGKFN